MKDYTLWHSVLVTVNHAQPRANAHIHASICSWQNNMLVTSTYITHTLLLASITCAAGIAESTLAPKLSKMLNAKTKAQNDVRIPMYDLSFWQRRCATKYNWLRHFWIFHCVARTLQTESSFVRIWNLWISSSHTVSIETLLLFKGKPCLNLPSRSIQRRLFFTGARI